MIGLGEGEAGVFRVETCARNTRKERPDNEGVVPLGAPISNSGPNEIHASADSEKLVAALTALDVPARLSVDAGAYLCEELLYTLETLRTEHSFLQRVLFVHLPPGHTELRYQHQDRRCDETLLLEFTRVLLQSMGIDFN